MNPPLEGLLDRVRNVVPLIRERAADAERHRKPDDDVIDALAATGVFKSFVPKRYGGYEIGMDLYVDIGICVSEACASTGWITTFYMEHCWQFTSFSAGTQQEVFGPHGFALAPGSVNPNAGQAEPCDGGYRLSGHWKFSSGIMHAEWVLVNAGVVDKDSPIPRKFLLRPNQVEVIDTWHVDGMAATGSQDIVVRDAFVPERYVSLPLGSAGDGEIAYLSRFPVLPFLALTAGIPALGAARRAVELFRELTGRRVRFGTHKVQAHNVASQIRLANAYTRVCAAESAMRQSAGAIEAQARGDIVLSELEQLQNRLAIGRVVHECLGVVRDIMDAAGSSVHFAGQELGRIHRDVQMMSTHTIFDLELAAQQCGRAMLEAEGLLFTRT